MDNSPAIQHMLDIESISQLKARYCRFIDTKQWERLRGLFAADARFEGFGPALFGADVDALSSGAALPDARMPSQAVNAICRRES